jgi:hypothetical protein
MCFSAAASLGVSVALAGVGAASIRQNTSPPHRLLAAVPFLFAAQQAAEGFVWLTMGDAARAMTHQLAVSAFLGFAFVIWPVYAPLALYSAERNPDRRRVLKALTLFGAAVAGSAAILIARWHPVASVAGHSIRYDYLGGEDSLQNGLLLLAYIVPTVTPFVVSTTKLVRTIGGTLVVSLIVTVVMERDALTSVWCFFAAILSGLIAVAVAREQSSVPVRTERTSPAQP